MFKNNKKKKSKKKCQRNFFLKIAIKYIRHIFYNTYLTFSLYFYRHNLPIQDRIQKKQSAVESTLNELTKVITVTITESVTSTMVKRRYLPIKGITNEVDGIISTENNNYNLCFIYKKRKFY